MKRLQKIVITGAPSSGKSSTLLALQNLDKKSVVLVPESAVVLLSGGYPAPEHDKLEEIRAFQKIILSLHESLESIFEMKNPTATHMVLDRAKLDGTAFWPPGPDNYLKSFAIDYQTELENYDAVLFFEIPEEKYFGGVHQARFHNYAQSVESGKKLEKIWSAHSNFIRVPAQTTLDEKIKNALTILLSLFEK